MFARTTFPDQQALIRTLVNQVQVQGPGFGMFVLNMPDLFENEDGVRGFDVNRPGLLQRSVGRASLKTGVSIPFRVLVCAKTPSRCFCIPLVLSSSSLGGGLGGKLGEFFG